MVLGGRSSQHGSLDYTPMFSFGHGGRDKLPGSNSPGPVYNLPTKIGSEGPKFSISGPHVLKKGDDQSPGPVYQLRDSMGNAPKFGFGTATREGACRASLDKKMAAKEFAGVYSPGPGHYSVKGGVTEDGPKWRFGTGGRKEGKVVEQEGLLPGPGTYELRSTLGPNTGSTYIKSPSHRVGTAPKLGIDNSSSLTSPGPGAYALSTTIGPVNQDPSFTRSPAPKLGTATREQLQKSSAGTSHIVPGPGMYDPVIPSRPHASK
mmetsp:Transcript_9556/g.15667  ORF Transcript_9556/g.15667 Transcript_9556/m.15667 type:complete len:262 (+) Transcript_9556:122-907(+)|eukprot:CAMPEP_0184647060 /NCGR_PEP_ID=MMETSP0308-20130426/3947_1 /TAXON_ID=38269 /ORGANISM="Gloeochaete witrockiana, Strain SAG 46.84" /LENGTH=261 /DNA_ID=CAMNT_0027077733 /DNA_START=41 /DNA_END=826 /DNA_ORIENTATION=+